MIPVKLTLSSGTTMTVNVDAPGELVTALSMQTAAHTVQNKDGSTTILNMRNVVALDYNLNPPADADPEHDPDRTVNQLKEALDAKGIEYDPKALKADLQKLAIENGV